MDNIFNFSLSKRVFKDLDRTSKEELPIIRDAIYGLMDNPFPVGAKKIKGKKSLILRIRVKKYRILYKIDIKEKRIMILAVSQRKDIYKKNIE